MKALLVSAVIGSALLLPAAARLSSRASAHLQ